MRATLPPFREKLRDIATLRIIIEQSLEWQAPLYSILVDFQKAFDSVDREVIWRLMHHYGFPPKFINIIRQLYENATCQVIHNGKLTEPFTVQTGVRQGCILSPTIFLMVIDWVMRQSTTGKRTGIQWTLTKQLEDLDFADDIALLSHKYQDAQEKLKQQAACSHPTTSGKHQRGLQTFINRCLRNILNIRWPEVISNQDLWERTRQAPIEQEIKKRNWGWIGHTLRKPSSNTTRQSLEWNPQGKRKVGRPRQTWRRSTDAEARAAGMTWAELRRTSQNRVRWRSVVAALCSYRSEED
ncbi:hypothetical protein EGW08_010767 [Elysia chlorotica]|uniref:Reverse transcriptase domain-containing protein n=1 Tax=Elysia chlorotica TaxID=188477 RepID=A0A3S0ZS74_ELYCH|nr:hypothetical protein EGW08_010767 [Elysia chlorotica]